MTIEAFDFAVQAHERIVFGRPAGEAVVAEAQRLGARRVFVVTNRSLARSADGLLPRMIRALGNLHAGTFAGMSAHSRREDVVEAANRAREAGADLLVAVGGGSVIDGAKVALLCLWRGFSSVEQFAQLEDGAQDAGGVPADPIRFVAVPTTFSAAEFTSTAAVNDEASRTKRVLSHRMFAARSIVLDPAATLDTPRQLLLATGVRAVDHAVETYCSPGANPVTRARSMRGFELLAQALPAIARDPLDRDARLQAQLGMWDAVSAVAAGVSVGASHALGYVLGGTFGVAHGETSCILLPAVLRWNAELPAPRQRELARAVSAPNEDLGAYVAALVESLGLPRRLRDVRIRMEDLDGIATRSLAYPATAANSRPVRTDSDARHILDLAY